MSNDKETSWLERFVKPFEPLVLPTLYGTLMLNHCYDVGFEHGKESVPKVARPVEVGNHFFEEGMYTTISLPNREILALRHKDGGNYCLGPTSYVKGQKKPELF